ncbi:hypothetical protein GUJ93_ZPchr0010g7902 [Zizania palustris]|uniref:Uncharacterized protein n=1 Tax=Zizania palustris TaxID=103762 RepID=A0A8J5WAI9_ZIZPA|nr:hypothetical protein GUJ93_ZPchr0010g10525 [Zizania palustris]KAG8086944.1 hypothetical protein GUJ93_ZPchr0010g7902 [Zizania palustris]
MATTQTPAGAGADVDAREANGGVAAALANRRNGAHAVLAAATALVGIPSAYGVVRALVLWLLLLLGCTTVHLSMGGGRRWRRRRRSSEASAAPSRVDRSVARLRWTGFHALLFLGGSRLLLGPAAYRRPQPAQVLVAYALFVVGAVLVLVSTFYDGVPLPRSVRPAAAAAARGLDGFLFGGRLAVASDGDVDG